MRTDPGAKNDGDVATVPPHSLPRLPFDSPRQSRCPATVSRLVGRPPVNVAGPGGDLYPDRRSNSSATPPSRDRSSAEPEDASVAAADEDTAHSRNSLRSASSRNTIASSSSSSSFSSNRDTLRPANQETIRPVLDRTLKNGDRSDALTASVEELRRDPPEDRLLSHSRSPLQLQSELQQTTTTRPAPFGSSPNLRFDPSHPLRQALNGGAVSRPAGTERAVPTPFTLLQHQQSQPQQTQPLHNYHFFAQTHQLRRGLRSPPVAPPAPDGPPFAHRSALNIPFPQRSLSSDPQQPQPPLAASTEFLRAYCTVHGKAPAASSTPPSAAPPPAEQRRSSEGSKTKKKLLNLAPFRGSKKSKKREKAKQAEVNVSTASLTTTSTGVSGGGGDLGAEDMASTSGILAGRGGDYQDIDSYSTTSSTTTATEPLGGVCSGVYGTSGSQSSRTPLCASDLDLRAAAPSDWGDGSAEAPPTHHGSLHSFAFGKGGGGGGGALAFVNPFSTSTNLDSPDPSLHETSVDSQLSNDSAHTAPNESVSHDVDASVPSSAGASSSSKLAVFFGLTRRNLKSQLKRTKSMTRLYRDRKRLNASASEVVGPRPAFGKLKASRSHESLLTNVLKSNGIPPSLNLGPGVDVEIKPLHPSVLGQEHCFQVSTPSGAKFFACRTAEEREKWMECIRKTVRPDLDLTRRRDNSLTVWILEAKCVSPKKKYFCEIVLDRGLYARTTSKTKGDILFWGERFHFSDLPDVRTVTVNIYREADGKKKKKGKGHALLGAINIPTSSIDCGQMVERWYPAPSLTPEAAAAASPAAGGKGPRDSSSLPGAASSGVIGGGGKSFASPWSSSSKSAEVPVLRVKAKWQTVDILPMSAYRELLEYLVEEYASLCEVLEPNIPVKAKENAATALVRVLHKIGKAQDFLVDITVAEIESLENESLVFRGNTLATKSVEAYMKLVGERYLRDTVGDFVRGIVEAPDDCEVDPQRVTNLTSLHKNQANLTMYVEMVWVKVINSACYFPIELRRLFSRLRQKCLERDKIEVLENLISSSIFLRYICPAVLSPSLFSLTQEYPQEKAARNLTLIAKTVQTLANFSQFGRKEDYMCFMNSFVESEWASMKAFLHQISSPEPSVHHLEHDPGGLDLGREVSVLRGILDENLERVPRRETIPTMAKLGKILAKLTSLSASGSGNGGGAGAFPDADASPVKSEFARLNPSVPPSATFGGLIGARCYETSPSITRSAQSLPSAESSLAHAGFLTTGRTRKLAARDLRTSDDYVLCSALEESPGGTPTAPRAAEAVATQHLSQIDLIRQQQHLQNNPHLLQQPGQQQQQQRVPQNYATYALAHSRGSPYSQQGHLSHAASQVHAAAGSAAVLSPCGRGGASSADRSSSRASNNNNNFSPGQHLSMCSNEDYVDLVNFMERLSGEPSRENHHGPECPMSASAEDSTRPSSLQPLNFSNPLSRAVVESGLYSRPPCRFHPPLIDVDGANAGNSASPLVNGDYALARSPQQMLHPQPMQPQRRQSHPLSRLSGVSDSSTSSSNGEDSKAAPTGDSASSLLSSSAPTAPPFDTARSASPRPRSSTTTPSDGAVSPISCPETTPTSGPPGAAPIRRRYSSHTGPRMGVRLVQRQLAEQRRSAADYEAEIETLRRQLTELSSTQSIRLEALTREFESKLASERHRTRRQQEEREALTKGLVARMARVEEELRREREEMREKLEEKGEMIETQEKTIAALDGANRRLLRALGELREGGGEGEEERERPEGKGDEEEDGGGPVTPTFPPPEEGERRGRKGKESGC